ncbi:MAG TPA: tetratricopeptide repeat protein [Ktedonobacterales bacterium]|nr:tetratricopeptide repeat protein [Ktedonobacterales bacterium]
MAETTLRDTLRLAEDDIGAGRPTDALTRCQHILTHYPEMLEAQRVLGEAHLALNQTKEAFQAFDQVLISDPENTLAYCGRALISHQLGDYDSALDCYYQACELSLGNRQLRLEFRLLASQANQPDFVLSRVGLARLYMRGDLLAHAIREWEQILQSDPERIDAHIGLAETLWRDGQPEQAARRCNIILEAVPSCLKAQLLLGEIAYRAGRQEEARQSLEQAQRQDPDSRMARELFADALIDDKAWAGFLLSEPAKIPVMEALASEAAQQLASLALSSAPPQFDAQISGASYPQTDFVFPFLAADAPNAGPPLREGESLEAMLAALADRPAHPEITQNNRTTSRPAAQEAAPIDRFQALLQSFAQNEEQESQSAGLLAGQTGQPGAAAHADGQAATSEFAEAMFWLDTASHPASDTPQVSINARMLQDTPSTPVRARTDEGLSVMRPRAQEVWAEEEDTESGWLRWIQAQGATPLDTSGPEEDVSEPFAALLGRTERARKQPTKLWDAPDPEFVHSYLPTDTIPQQVVRLTPGSSARPLSTAGSAVTPGQQWANGAEGEESAALAGLSSVSLRPLTLQELEASFSVSGLTRLEGPLATRADEKKKESWDDTMGESPILTIAEDDYPGRLELAERQRKTGRLDEALGHYRAIIRGAPDLINNVIAGLLESTGEGPEQAAAYRLLGDAYTRRGSYMEALEAYNRGLAASRGQ